jgi:hypothetical protein
MSINLNSISLIYDLINLSITTGAIEVLIQAKFSSSIEEILFP